MSRTVRVIPASQVREQHTQERPKIRVAAYCRVSTDHEEQIGSFQNQVAYYTDLIANHADWVSAGIYADEGISGTGTRKREGFHRLIQASLDGQIDLIITKSISRFARNTADCLQYTRQLRERNIPVIFEKEGINSMESSGELLLTILSSIAQEESRNISENTRWGMAELIRQSDAEVAFIRRLLERILVREEGRTEVWLLDGTGCIMNKNSMWRIN